MSPEDCRQILGVSAEAGPEAIRQAYIDLARVWHPDRFESDPRLRRIAEERFQQISQAYSQLKSQRRASSPPPAAPRPEPKAATTEPPPPPPPQSAWTPPRPTGRARRSFCRPVRFDSVNQYVLIGCLVAAPFLAAFKIVPLLRVPVFDADMATAHALRPRILEPMRSIDPSADVGAAADTISEWARGDVIDLWKPAGTEAPRTVVAAPAAAPPPAPHRLERQPAESAAPAPPPSNGADLLVPGRSGAGELLLANRSDLEAVVKLVSRNRTVVRAVYVAPESSALVGAIGVGVYNLDVDLGRDFDLEHLRFRKSRVTPAPIGPFQFAEITSDSGISGSRYEVVLNSR